MSGQFSWSQRWVDSAQYRDRE